MPEYRVPAVRIVPEPDDQVAFVAAGRERLRWHFSPRYSRPFFYPIIGPAGLPLTRMGHPAAPNHDHHKSLWFAHHDVAGVDYWAEHRGPQQIRQERWVHYQDGHDEAAVVVRIGWFDAHRVKVIDQEMIAVLRPLAAGESWLEIQTKFTPTIERLPLGRTNFGFMGLRVAASLSAHYGGGRLTGADGQRGERALFARQFPWMDYSGPIDDRRWEGITWFDHPSNPNYPSSWHVRDDGWMSPAFCLREGFTLQRARPLVLRYGFHIHAGDVNQDTAERHRRRFADSRPWEVVRAPRPWQVRLQRNRH